MKLSSGLNWCTGGLKGKTPTIYIVKYIFNWEIDKRMWDQPVASKGMCVHMYQPTSVHKHMRVVAMEIIYELQV